MESIKEIALRVGLSVFDEHPYDKGHVVSLEGYTWIDDKLAEFAEDLIAEIQKQNEPVGYQRLFDAIAKATWVAASPGINISVERFTKELGEIFTFPPSTEQIENKVAEACAKLTEDWFDGENKHPISLSRDMREGGWREYL